MKASLLLLLGALSAPAAWALDANDVRGGWETTVGGTQHIYDFEIRGDQVTGIYCTDCSDATTLAFVIGKLGANGLRFVVDHVRDDGSTSYQDHVTARIEGDHLAVTGQAGGPAGGTFHWAMHKDPRGPAPFGGVAVSAVLPQPGAPAANAAAYGAHGQEPPPMRAPTRAAGPRGGGFRMPPYQQPGPWEQITPAQLLGVWYAGTGPGKQHFIIRRLGNRLLGMVCGPCDNPYTMAALDTFEIRGDTLTFRIHHEDFGLGTLPFYNLITAHLGRDELRIISAVANNLPLQQQAFAHFSFSLLGPVSFEATAVH
ncbi:MAG TPA: hypothetical protein VHX52_13230 [Steroidobacteraceae bacterium]|jgi:hypothetical protein|nr:hypothetical protein [Steroidobacteraceae bacterium]